MKQTRTLETKFTTREDNGTPQIEGYFALFNSVYDMGGGMSESIAKGAFTSSMGNDVRALINHDTTLVLGRTSAGTLSLTQDAMGLYGVININPKDSDAMNLYERVKRGDVSQCSFGFDIINEDTEIKDDDSIHWTIKDLYLYEVSPVTFPAYKDTAISARAEQREDIKKRKNEAWKLRMKGRLKDGIKGIDAEEED